MYVVISYYFAYKRVARSLSRCCININKHKAAFPNKNSAEHR